MPRKSRYVRNLYARAQHAQVCVEVAITDEGVAVRDTKDRNKPPHIYTHREWVAFVGGVKDGEFDV